MSTPPTGPTTTPTRDLTPSLLRGWALPDVGDSKYSRGQVLVVGGAARTPGAAQLAGLAALRVGAGHLTLAVAEQAAVPMAVATPEAGVYGLPQNPQGSVTGEGAALLEDQLGSADVVVLGPGLDDPELTADLVRAAVPLLSDDAWLVLDAYALGVLPGMREVVEPLAGRLVLTPNSSEGGRLLGRDLDDLEADVREIARTYGAVVSCQTLVADPDGRCWRTGAGQVGLATSGSGDVLAGAVAGLLARGTEPAQAVCWASHVHAAAGDRLAASVGRLGFLANELLAELPRVLVELGA
ncbi:yjeF C-terminal region, hydroxyethylthiazole kinase-related [Microlunatus sagamiharensis]|uniref:ADP-dependent (S)-NAD(P)H-hydrate dehydratase n=1 Tax=Microlunatus sagamiharensis TaxID=546874 RepID=A0A1H2MAT8_9ACTN|nr:NAD(P)H-hydrate dehydratase [Microlunatus sagamiharensis]SDU90370.1 yjeF C-terminal region, hydroxyethylthiazole kinase-related [Microlunatus sagamiharensis]